MKRFIGIISSVILVLQILVVPMQAEVNLKPEEVLNDLGLLLNISDQEMMSELSREVGLTMILKSLGYKQSEADEAVSNGYFIDTNGWSKGWAELAYVEGITTGTGQKHFSPTAPPLTKKEFIAFQLRALGYDSSEAWNMAESLGKTSGLMAAGGDSISDSSFTKRDASYVMYNALTASLVTTGDKLVKKLIDNGVISSAKAESYGLYSSKFVVESIASDNLKVMTIEFSKAIDEASLSGDTIELSRGSTELIYDANLLDGVSASGYALNMVDSQRVDIVIGSPQKQSTDMTLTIKGLKDMDGNTVTSTSRELTLKDTSKPVVMSAELLNPVYIKIDFNEPVQFKIGTQVYDDVLLDDERIVATGSISRDSKTVYLELGQALTTGTYDLTVTNVVDFAGYQSEEIDFELLAIMDTQAPTIIEANALNRDKVVIEFDEIIREGEGEIVVNGITYSLEDEDDQEYMTINDNIIIIDLQSPLPASAATNGISCTFDDIEDMIGNRVKIDVAFKVKAPYDTTAPTVDISVDSNNAIVLKFSEPVQDFSSNFFVVSEFDDEGEESLVTIQSYGFEQSSETVYKIQLSDPLVNAVEYEFMIMSIKDKSVFQNRLILVETTVVMGDKEQPSIESVKYLSDETIRISFSEAMDVTKLIDPSYYTYHEEDEDEEYPLSMVDYTIDADSDGEYVDIKIDGLESDDRIEIGKLSDESGLIISNMGRTYSFGSIGDFDFLDIEAELIELNSIRLTATDHEFKVINADDFVLKSGNSESNTHYIKSAAIDSEDASIAYLKLSSKIDGGDARVDGGDKQYIYLVDEPSTSDTFNQPLEIDALKAVLIKDKTRADIELDTSEANSLIINLSEVVGGLMHRQN